MIDKLRLTDFWKKKSCSNLNGVTWCDAENNPESRIDYILINEKFVINLVGCVLERFQALIRKGVECQTIDF